MHVDASDADYKTTCVLLSVCLSYGLIFCSILMKFCTEVGAPKSKNAFVRGSKSDGPFPWAWVKCVWCVDPPASGASTMVRAWLGLALGIASTIRLGSW